MTDLTGARWRKGTRSGGNGGNCVEVADNLTGIIAVRDSKDVEGPVLCFEEHTWALFIGAVKGAGLRP
ncbi:DUF397 domain-containing protein [Micromonospora globispora]|uniref:DUF397 domain-containing protein n=1 Tax=Micromonospora globispora TaxID=1450148 RepID=A0A317K570_9ACTN|nr:DUF397 domain-containing protein [Micromonospora globispora]PWU48061.1 DUF397 domain-containing protein [Micromonospora globispora]PWU58858.1 DUF397 domain-containing protein [Micromonospora globispora]